MERLIGYKMAELEPIRVIIARKQPYLESDFCEKNYLQIPTPPRPFNVFEQTLH